MKVFEAMTKFQQKILCHKLPKKFIHINISSDSEVKGTNQQQKCIRDFKRRMLQMELERYQTEIQHYDHLYEQELNTFKIETDKLNLFIQMTSRSIMIHFVEMYVYHHTKILMREIRYKESRLHFKLRRHHQLLTKKIISVYPQIIVDLPKVTLNRVQLDYLSRTGKLKSLL